MTAREGGRVVGYVVAYVASNGEKGYRSWDDPSGLHFSGRRQVFGTSVQAQQLRDYSATPAPPAPERKVFRVVRYPKKVWGVWCTPKPDNHNGKAGWWHSYPVDKPTAQEVAANYKGAYGNERWTYEVRRYTAKPDAPHVKYVIGRRRPIQFDTKEAALEKIRTGFPGGLRDWTVVKVPT